MVSSCQTAGCPALWLQWEQILWQHFHKLKTYGIINSGILTG